MLSGVDPCDAEEQSIHKIYKTLPESVSQNTMDAIICGLQKEAVDRPNDIASFQNILEHGNAGGGHNPTDPIIPDPPKPISTKLIAIACVAVVSLGGWFAWNKFNKNVGGNATELSANDDTQQSQKKDSTSVIADNLMPEHEDIKMPEHVDNKEPVAKTSKKDEQKQSNKSEEKIKPADSHKPTSIPSTKPTPKPTPSPKSGTVNLGYATWTGGLLNGKPHGNGTMKFHASHAVSGCYMTPQAGDYIIGYCENGVIQNGGLFRDGKKIDTVIR